MKLFIALVAGGFILGGFIGAEIKGDYDDFSLAWATAGAATVFLFVFGMGAFFDAQDHKRKRESRRNQLTPEVTKVFDTMLGVNRAAGETPQSVLIKRYEESVKPKSPFEGMSENAREDFIQLVTNTFWTFSQLVAPQISTALPHEIIKGKHPFKKTFAIFMTNKQALGYIFGAYDSIAQQAGLLAFGKDKSMYAIDFIYESIWSKPSSEVMVSMSISLQDDEDFMIGRMQGGNEALFFMRNKGNKVPAGLHNYLKREK